MKLRILYTLAIGVMLTAIGCDRSEPPTGFDQNTTIKPVPTLDYNVAPGRYIVVFNDNVSSARAMETATDMATDHAAKVDFVYANAINGFAGEMSEEQANRLRMDPRVKFVEPDHFISLPKTKVAPAVSTLAQTTPWGVTFVGGIITGVTPHTVYVIDTGLDLAHPELNISLNKSRNFVGRGKNSPQDGNGHGTHVGGTIGAKNNTSGVVGVAPGALLVAIRVLDNNGSGYYSEIIAGLNYVTSIAQAGEVANMSFGGPPSSALDAAVKALANKGVYISLAAGNSGVDASTTSPARVNHANVYTVSAISASGCLTSWSNYGSSTVDYAAPGLNILSTWRNKSYATISGTSMAAPHVAGLLALGMLSSAGAACSDPDGVADPLAHR